MTHCTLVMASHNQGKIKEYQDFFQPLGVTMLSAKALDLPEPEETGTTFQENACIKAQILGDATGELTLSDDGGLVIPSLGGHPGVLSRRWAEEVGGFVKAFQHLESLLRDKSPKAFYELAIGLYDPHEKKVTCFQGTCWGHLAFPPQGQQGFGYDPIFVPQGYQESFASLGIEIKEKISHRTQALTQLIKSSLWKNFFLSAPLK